MPEDPPASPGFSPYIYPYYKYRCRKKQPVGLRIRVSHLRTKRLKVCVATGKEHAGDRVQEDRGVLLVDEERSEGLLGADDAAHP